MDGKYTFNEFCNNLDEGYQIYYTYVRNRYLLYKTSERHSMLTFKRIKEMFPHMEEIEYKV